MLVSRSASQKTFAAGTSRIGSTGKSQPPIGWSAAALLHHVVVFAIMRVPPKALPGKPRDVELIEMIILVIVAPVGRHGELLPITRRNVGRRQLVGMFRRKSAGA